MVNKFKLESSKSIETKEAIIRTLEIANNYAGELSIEVLPLENIELDPDNKRELLLTLQDAINGIDSTDVNYERKKQDWKSLESLAKTIMNDQLINPVFVYRYGNKCRLIAGERRTLASAIAGKKEIIARIASQRPVGTKLRVLQWIENNERADLSLPERILSLESIIKEYLAENNKNNAKERITSQLLGDLTGMSSTQARRYILIIKSKPEIKQLILDGKLENIKIIELICMTESAEHQKLLLNMALAGQTYESIVKFKKELETNQNVQPMKKEMKNRRKPYIRLGAVKPDIVKIIVDALISSNVLKDNILKQLNNIKGDILWNSNESVEVAFRNIIALLEQGVSLK